MEIDLELYRREARLRLKPPLRLSVVDITPDFPQQTLVFVHGFGGNAAQWGYQLKQFSQDNRVIAMDLRGHGDSDKPDSAYDMAEIQEDLETLLYTLGVNAPFTLIGHSYGAAVAAEFATAHPERVKRLVLIAAAMRFKLHPFYRTALRLPSPLLKAAAPFVKGWLSAPPEILRAWYENNLSRWEGSSVFSRLAMPALVIRGYLDRLFEKTAYEDVARAIPGCEEIDVGASGHMVMLERAEAVNRAIARFIDQEGSSWSPDGFAPEDRRHAELLKERPWLSQYDNNVPYTISIPRVPLQSLLESAARRFPRQTALILSGKRITYKSLNQDVNRFAQALLSLGLSKGDRVMLILPNIPQLVIAFYGTLKAGGVAVFGLPTNRPEELVAAIQESGARCLVTLTQYDQLIDQIKQQITRQDDFPLQKIIFTHIAEYASVRTRLRLWLSPQMRERHLLDISLDANMLVFKSMLEGMSQAAPEVNSAPIDLAAILFTGGTTAKPVGVMLTHRNLLANALQTRHWITDAREGQECVLCAVPISHSYGLTAVLNVPIALGATILLEAGLGDESADDGGLDWESILKDIQHYRPTVFPGTPQMFLAIKDFPGVRQFGLETIRLTISGADPLSLEVLESYEKITRSALIEGYGLSEASPITHITPVERSRKPGSIGLPIPSTEARIVDLRKGSKVMPVGQIGELAVRGPQVMLGYWQNSRATAQAITAEGWLLTGDVAQMDNEGFFRIIARKEDMWYQGRPDLPASPRTIEEVIQEIPQVKEVAVTAITGKPVAFVIANQGQPRTLQRPSAESVIAYCKRRLPPELVPRLIIFVDEFPRSFIGKVLRRELARRLESKEGDKPAEEQPPGGSGVP